MKVKFKYCIQKDEIRGQVDLMVYSQYWVEASCKVNDQILVANSTITPTKMSPTRAKSYKEEAKRKLIEKINNQTFEDEYIKQIDRILGEEEVEI